MYQIGGIKTGLVNHNMYYIKTIDLYVLIQI